jgi:uncharacterized membrane protein YbaN (DUF454 family)
MDHLTLSSSSASGFLGRKISSTRAGRAWSSGRKDENDISENFRPFVPPGKISNNDFPGDNHASYENTSTEPNGDLLSAHTKPIKSTPSSSLRLSSSTPAASENPHMPGEREREFTMSNQIDTNQTRMAQPKNDEDYNYDDEHVGHRKGNSTIEYDGRHSNEINSNWDRDYNDVGPAANSGASTNQEEFIALAKEHTMALMSALSSAVSSRNAATETNTSLLHDLVEYCKEDKEMLQVKLSEVLEEDADTTDKLMELFSISEEICAAIDAGEDALKLERERTKKKKVAEGPTIELLEENRDVFSLICMLRAPNEKRMQAALALIKFAKEDQVLRDEIISSGGIHSFLTLFQQTRGMTRELKVVASLAVAHILPSYVASSQTTPSIGLKLVECLHFLAKSNPVSPNGIVITVEEMCKAASVGVNVLWINSIHPLIALKKVKDESTSSPPSLRPGKTVRFGRLRSRTG